MTSAKLNLSKIERNSHDLLSTELDDELVIMQIKTGNYLKLNNLSKVIWRKIEKPIAFEKLIQDLTSEYDVTEEVCKRETMRLLETLGNQGLLK